MSPSTNGYRALTEAVSHRLATLRADLPDVMKGIGELALDAFEEFSMTT